MFKTKWKVARTGWPYASGYGVYRKNWLTGWKTILDTGLSYEDAVATANALNQK